MNFKMMCSLLSLIVKMFYVSPSQKSIQTAFDTANVYARTFEPFRLFYKENEDLDLEALKEQDHGTSSSS